MIFIRADAGRDIGAGHVMRCLAVARELELQGESVRFITVCSESLGLLSGFEAVCIEPDELRGMVEREKPSLLLVDSYDAGEAFFCEISRLVRTAYIDDLNKVVLDVDFLINYNITSAIYDYSGYSRTRTKLLLGPEYAPLRDEFREIPPHEVKDTISDVMVSAGGSDPERISERIMNELCPLHTEICFNFVTGSLNPQITHLRKIAPANAVLHVNAKMSELMRNCDMAISAAGSTLYELCACGVPTIAFSLADNQLDAVREFGARGVMLSSGDCRNNPGFIMSLNEAVNIMKGNPELRGNMSVRMKELVDGRGACRIAEVICGRRTLL